MDRNHSQLHFLFFLFLFLLFLFRLYSRDRTDAHSVSRVRTQEVVFVGLDPSVRNFFFFREHRECEATKVLLGVWKVLLRAVITTANVPS